MDDARSVKDEMTMTGFFSDPLSKTDPELAEAIADELARQQDQIEMKETTRREEKQDARRSERNDRLAGMREKYGLKDNKGDGYKDNLIDDDY